MADRATTNHEDVLTRRTGLNAEQRQERARKAGAVANTVSNYVARITRNPSALSPADLEELRQLVGPVVAADVYADGIKAGARLALEKIMAVAAEVE